MRSVSHTARRASRNTQQGGRTDQRTLALRRVARRGALRGVLHRWRCLVESCAHDRRRACTRVLSALALAVYVRRSSTAAADAQRRARLLHFGFMLWSAAADTASARREAREAYVLARVWPILDCNRLRRAVVAWHVAVARLRDARRRAERRGELFRLAQGWLDVGSSSGGDPSAEAPEAAAPAAGPRLTDLLTWELSSGLTL